MLLNNLTCHFSLHHFMSFNLPFLLSPCISFTSVHCAGIVMGFYPHIHSLSDDMALLFLSLEPHISFLFCLIPFTFLDTMHIHLTTFFLLTLSCGFLDHLISSYWVCFGYLCAYAEAFSCHSLNVSFIKGTSELSLMIHSFYPILLLNRSASSFFHYFFVPKFGFIYCLLV